MYTVIDLREDAKIFLTDIHFTSEILAKIFVQFDFNLVIAHCKSPVEDVIERSAFLTNLLCRSVCVRYAARLSFILNITFIYINKYEQ